MEIEAKCANQNGVVDHLVLWDSEKEKEKKDYEELGKFCGGKHSLQAALRCADDVESVKFVATSATTTYTSIENNSKYFIYGNKGKNSISSGKLGPDSEVFDLTVTPYTGKDATGTAGTPLKIKVDFKTKSDCNDSSDD